MTSSSRARRKRKKAERFTPLRKGEESALMQALQASLRPIPANPESSEDEFEDAEIIVIPGVLQRGSPNEYNVAFNVLLEHLRPFIRD